VSFDDYHELLANALRPSTLTTTTSTTLPDGTTGGTIGETPADDGAGGETSGASRDQ
jgi:hypothetical protein